MKQEGKLVDLLPADLKAQILDRIKQKKVKASNLGWAGFHFLQRRRENQKNQKECFKRQKGQSCGDQGGLRQGLSRRLT